MDEALLVHVKQANTIVLAQRASPQRMAGKHDHSMRTHNILSHSELLGVVYDDSGDTCAKRGHAWGPTPMPSTGTMSGWTFFQPWMDTSFVRNGIQILVPQYGGTMPSSGHYWGLKKCFSGTENYGVS